MLDLDRLEVLAMKATPGPWLAQYEVADEQFCVTGAGHFDGGRWMVCPEVATLERGGECDAAFIEAARTAVPGLIARVRELEHRLAIREGAERRPRSGLSLALRAGGCRCQAGIDGPDEGPTEAQEDTMSAAEREAEQRWPSVTFEEISYPRSAVRAYMRGAFVAGAEWQAEQDEQAQHAYTVRHLHDSHWRCACGHPLVDVSDKPGPASKDVLMAVLAEHESHKRESRAGDQ